jgi:hypothetical protein
LISPVAILVITFAILPYKVLKWAWLCVFQKEKVEKIVAARKVRN